jgi:hypothetical protein
MLDSSPRGALFQRSRDIGILETLFVAIMRLYGEVLGCLCTANILWDFFKSTIGLKQGCNLSSTFFGIHIDELEPFFREHI